jgi:biopolymer transport protein ExbD
MAEIESGGGGGKKGRKKMSTKVDMTPMVDLAFLLITFFMLTTTLNKQQVMQLNTPPKIDPNEKITPPEVDESRGLTIILGEENKVFYYFKKGEETQFHETDYNPEEGIRKVLMDKKQQIKDPVVIIKPMKTSTYKNVVDMLDEIAITKIEYYTLTNIEPGDLALVENERKKYQAQQ